MYFNPRSLTGATTISHFALVYCHDFNPRSLTGATAGMIDTAGRRVNFNPRSLTGATYGYNTVGAVTFSSIHAPSRERPSACVRNILLHIYFNPRSLTGATVVLNAATAKNFISIHAPSRERLDAQKASQMYMIFQSTLPHGSDPAQHLISLYRSNFNPRSLTGATIDWTTADNQDVISIHAPSRERPVTVKGDDGDGRISIHAPSRERLTRI